MKKVWKILTDGIRLFLDYAIELKETRPEMFDEMMVDYELSMHLRKLRTSAESVLGSEFHFRV